MGSVLAGDGYWDKMPVVLPPTAPHIVVMIREKSDPLAIFGGISKLGKGHEANASCLCLLKCGDEQ